MLYKSTKLVHKLQQELREEIQNINLQPHIAVVVVGNDPATKSFVSIKKRFAESLSIPFDEYFFDELITTNDLIKQIEKISSEEKITALIVQLPLPKTINKDLVLQSIPQRLDVDILNNESYKIFLERNKPLPPVAGAVKGLLEDLNLTVDDKEIVVVGFGALVGKPVHDMFVGLGLQPKIVDVETSKEDRKKILQEADIIISGTGTANSIVPTDIKKGAVVIDAGTSGQSGELRGDVSLECAEKASVLTAVPGGIGPLTVASLFRNIIELAKNNNKSVL